jgi:hypothetical protein
VVEKGSSQIAFYSTILSDQYRGGFWKFSH